jgi:hypothetical protein
VECQWTLIRAVEFGRVNWARPCGTGLYSLRSPNPQKGSRPIRVAIPRTGEIAPVGEAWVGDSASGYHGQRPLNRQRRALTYM